jgi:hypothetical protein
MESRKRFSIEGKECPVELFVAMGFLYQDRASPWFVEKTESAINEFLANQPVKQPMDESIEYKVGLKLAEIRDQHSSWLESFVLSKTIREQSGATKQVRARDFLGRWRNLFRKVISKTSGPYSR